MVTPLTNLPDFFHAIRKTALTVIFLEDTGELHEQRILQYLGALTTTDLYSTPTYYTCPAFPEILEQYSIDILPALLMFSSKMLVEKVHDFNNFGNITVALKRHIHISDLLMSTKLVQLVNSAEVVVFMKGTKDNPQCHFSRDMVDILNKEGIAYNSFNVLEDEEMKQGLTDHTTWPTYPQLYVRGIFIGGIEVVKGMAVGGKLRENLNMRPNE